MSSIIVSPDGSRAPSAMVAEVLSVGPEAEEVVFPGDRVLVEIMSGPRGAPHLDASDYGYPEEWDIALVHCRLLKPGSEIDQEAANITLELKDIDSEIKLLKSRANLGASPEKRLDALQHRKASLEARMKAMFQRRKGCGRSMAYKPVRDPGLAQGILARVE